MRNNPAGWAGVMMLASLAGAAGARAAPDQPASASAQLSLDQARTIALHAQPGQVTDHQLEQEGGGSGLRYSFDIRSGSVTHEVGVDAKTGKVLENSVDNERDQQGQHAD